MNTSSLDMEIGELIVATAADDYSDCEQVEFVPGEPASKWSLVPIWGVVLVIVGLFVWGVVGQ